MSCCGEAKSCLDLEKYCDRAVCETKLTKKFYVLNILNQVSVIDA